MTRQEAIAEQARLFPDATLPDIALTVRAATNGSADPWEPDNMREVLAMLRARLETWEPTAETSAYSQIMNQGVKQMVGAAVMIGERWLGKNEEPS